MTENLKLRAIIKFITNENGNVKACLSYDPTTYAITLPEECSSKLKDDVKIAGNKLISVSLNYCDVIADTGEKLGIEDAMLERKITNNSKVSIIANWFEYNYRGKKGKKLGVKGIKVLEVGYSSFNDDDFE